jgi:hypothetical protein
VKNNVRQRNWTAGRIRSLVPNEARRGGLISGVEVWSVCRGLYVCLGVHEAIAADGRCREPSTYGWVVARSFTEYRA